MHGKTLNVRNTLVMRFFFLSLSLQNLDWYLHFRFVVLVASPIFVLVCVLVESQYCQRL